MAELPIKNAILDGELVCLDQDGRSQFLQLMRRKRQDVCFQKPVEPLFSVQQWQAA
jgi:ATP-dependent DNA ligase